MNKTLLKQIAKRILKYPEKYDQETTCGSACCIAGQAIFLKMPKLFKKLAETRRDRGFTISPGVNSLWNETSVWQEAGLKLLDITPKQWVRLCTSGDYWPARYAKQYREAETKSEIAQVGYDRIIHFIKTGK